MTDATLRLPKAVEGDPRAQSLLRAIEAHGAPLWSGSALRVPEAALAGAVATALRSAHSASRVVRGLEAAEQALAAEAHGLAVADRASGAPRGVRVSRLLVISNDGAERFHRQVEALLRRHAGRVLAIRVTADAETLGSLLYGPGRRARLLLVEHKDAVAALLLALAEQWEARDALS
ncbi:MAG: hypothetical protein DCC71_18275 [Proteobacteria bacterium]|nr:MAG: hypothetical protein DCC71_18275 [Pseudomonadota bacterium]